MLKVFLTGCSRYHIVFVFVSTDDLHEFYYLYKAFMDNGSLIITDEDTRSIHIVADPLSQPIIFHFLLTSFLFGGNT